MVHPRCRTCNAEIYLLRGSRDTCARCEPVTAEQLPPGQSEVSTENVPGWCRICGTDLPVDHVLCTSVHASQWYGVDITEEGDETEWWQR